MSKKKYILDEVREFQKRVENNSDDYSSHLIIGIDTDDEGFPQSTVTMTSAQPLELIGMCDHLINLLTSIKKLTLKKLQPKKSSKNKDFVNSPDFEKMTSALPKPIADKIRDFKRRMDAAIESGDADEMRKIKDELLAMKNPFKQMNDDLNDLTGKNDGDFDINDFK